MNHNQAACLFGALLLSAPVVVCAQADYGNLSTQRDSPTIIGFGNTIVVRPSNEYWKAISLTLESPKDAVLIQEVGQGAYKITGKLPGVAQLNYKSKGNATWNKNGVAYYVKVLEPARPAQVAPPPPVTNPLTSSAPPPAALAELSTDRTKRTIIPLKGSIIARPGQDPSKAITLYVPDGHITTNGEVEIDQIGRGEYKVTGKKPGQLRLIYRDDSSYQMRMGGRDFYVEVSTVEQKPVPVAPVQAQTQAPPPPGGYPLKYGPQPYFSDKGTFPVGKAIRLTPLGSGHKIVDFSIGGTGQATIKQVASDTLEVTGVKPGDVSLYAVNQEDKSVGRAGKTTKGVVVPATPPVTSDGVVVNSVASFPPKQHIFIQNRSVPWKPLGGNTELGQFKQVAGSGRVDFLQVSPDTVEVIGVTPGEVTVWFKGYRDSGYAPGQTVTGVVKPGPIDLMIIGDKISKRDEIQSGDAITLKVAGGIPPYVVKHVEGESVGTFDVKQVAADTFTLTAQRSGYVRLRVDDSSKREFANLQKIYVAEKPKPVDMSKIQVVSQEFLGNWARPLLSTRCTTLVVTRGTPPYTLSQGPKENFRINGPKVSKSAQGIDQYLYEVCPNNSWGDLGIKVTDTKGASYEASLWVERISPIQVKVSSSTVDKRPGNYVQMEISGGVPPYSVSQVKGSGQLMFFNVIGQWNLFRVGNREFEGTGERLLEIKDSKGSPPAYQYFQVQ